VDTVSDDDCRNCDETICKLAGCVRLLNKPPSLPPVPTPHERYAINAYRDNLALMARPKPRKVDDRA
jgi:hypothetical protein